MNRLFQKVLFPYILVFFFVSLPAVGQETKWQLISNSSGVKVYKRELKNNVIEFKGTAVIKAPPLKLISLLLDYDAYPKWQPEIKKVNILARPNKRTKVVYWAIDLPWPVSDRDSVVKSRVIVDNTNKWFHVKWREAKHRAKPENDDFIRVPLNRGQYSLKPIKNGTASWIEFSGYSDPGGLIPDWLVRWVSKDQIVAGVKRIRKRIKAGKYATSKQAKDISKQYSEVGTWR